jgi:hypothetical protein
MKIKIGIIGENTNDVLAVVGLLKKQAFAANLVFFELLEKTNSSFLDEGKGHKAADLAAAEFRTLKPDFILYIRDLDVVAKNRAKYKTQIEFRSNIFQKLNQKVNEQAIFMLNIYEIEALILADFEKFKRIYNNETWFFDAKTAAEEVKPKGTLKNFLGKDPIINDLIPKLRIDIISENHTHFKAFYSEFQKMIDNETYNSIPL